MKQLFSEEIPFFGSGLLTESEPKYGKSFPGFATIDGKDVARAYVRCVYGRMNGKIIDVDIPTNWVFFHFFCERCFWPHLSKSEFAFTEKGKNLQFLRDEFVKMNLFDCYSF